MKVFIILLSLLFTMGSFAKEPANGFKLTQIQSGSIYQQLGLKNGDIIKKINGKAPTTLESFESWLSETKNGDKISLTIERKGKAMTLHYTIK